MSRDMKSRKTTHKKSAGGTLIGMFIGLVLGVCIAAGVVWYINKAPLPFNQNVQNGDTRPASATTSQEPKALPGKPGDPAMEKRFQFYDILPGKADAVPEKATPPHPPTSRRANPKRRQARKVVRRSSCRQAPSAMRKTRTTRR